MTLMVFLVTFDEKYLQYCFFRWELVYIHIFEKFPYRLGMLWKLRFSWINNEITAFLVPQDKNCWQKWILQNWLPIWIKLSIISSIQEYFPHLLPNQFLVFVVLYWKPKKFAMTPSEMCRFWFVRKLLHCCRS